jgi:hypothetical protein
MCAGNARSIDGRMTGSKPDHVFLSMEIIELFGTMTGRTVEVRHPRDGGVSRISNHPFAPAPP